MTEFQFSIKARLLNRELPRSSYSIRNTNTRNGSWLLLPKFPDQSTAAKAASV